MEHSSNPIHASQVITMIANYSAASSSLCVWLIDMELQSGCHTHAHIFGCEPLSTEWQPILHWFEGTEVSTEQYGRTNGAHDIYCAYIAPSHHTPHTHTRQPNTAHTFTMFLYLSTYQLWTDQNTYTSTVHIYESSICLAIKSARKKRHSITSAYALAPNATIYHPAAIASEIKMPMAMFGEWGAARLYENDA